MAIIMPPAVNDSGFGTDGTILDVALWNALGAAIDAAVGVASTPGVVVVSATGTQTIAVTPQTRQIRCTNAALLTISALTGAVDGQSVTILANGSARVDIADGAGVGDAVLTGTPYGISLAPGGASPFCAGRATIMYDLSGSPRWRLIAHEQGAWLPYTPVWGNTGTANTVGASQFTGAYHLSGKTCRFRMQHTWGAGTVGGNAAFTYTFPFPPAPSTVMPFALLLGDASVGFYPGIGQQFGSNTFVAYSQAGPTGCSPNIPFVWTVNDYLQATGMIEL
jgi:hypothetical protein